MDQRGCNNMYFIACYLFIGLGISFLFDLLLKGDNELTSEEKYLLVIIYPLVFILLIINAIKKNV